MNFTTLKKHNYLLLFLLCLTFVVPDCFGQYFKQLGMNASVKEFCEAGTRVMFT